MTQSEIESQPSPRDPSFKNIDGEDLEAFYLYRSRLLIVWEFDAEGLVRMKTATPGRGDKFDGIAERAIGLDQIYTASPAGSASLTAKARLAFGAIRIVQSKLELDCCVCWVPTRRIHRSEGDETMSMDRRDFLKTTVVGSGLGAVAATGLFAETAIAGNHEANDGLAPESAAAAAELRETLAKLDASFRDPAWRITTTEDLADARSSMFHSLQHALEVYLEADPARPNFKRFVTPEKKLLGDNPDAIYYHALVDEHHSYRIRGNIAGATYTSFTVELGAIDGGNSTGVGAALNDTQFEIAKDGSFEIIASAKKHPGNWLELPKGSGSLSTRHYYERKVGVAADRLHHVPLMIEPLEQLPPPPRSTDADLAAGIRRVTKFLETSIEPFGARPNLPKYVSKIPNQLPQPSIDADDNANTGYAAVDNVYSMAPFMLKPGEALVIRGRFPRCRFSNVVLWNRYLQTLDYANRRSSLNRKQVELESDGSFKVVLAGSDPGVPNWLDTEGRAFGMMFWRFLLPEEEIAPLVTQVVPLADVGKA